MFPYLSCVIISPKKYTKLKIFGLFISISLLTVSSLFRVGADEHNRRGLAHYKAGKIDMAILEFMKAIEINPKYAKAYYNRGSVYALSNGNNKAIADLTMAGVQSGCTWSSKAKTPAMCGLDMEVPWMA